MDTTNPEYAAWKWLTDCTADEAETCLGLLAELTALRARVAELESAPTSTEWGAKWSDGGYCPAEPPRDEEFARKHARNWGTKVIRRYVGPWVYADTGERVWP